MFTQSDLGKKIRGLFGEIYKEQTAGEECAPLSPDTVLMDTGLDSLGFAILVTRLEEELGYDPFTLSEDAYYPSTYQEFLDFYLENQPS